MRLDTKEKRLQWRFVPENVTETIQRHGDTYIVYLYDATSARNLGNPAAVAYKGTSSKPSIYGVFTSLEHRTDYVNKWIDNLVARETEKKARTLARTQFANPYKVGDILYSSWGYEQTNIDFYQVVNVKSKHIEMQEIGQDATRTYLNGGTCVALKDSFVKDEPVLRKLVQSYDGQHAYVTMNSYSSASIWEGKPVSWSDGY